MKLYITLNVIAGLALLIIGFLCGRLYERVYQLKHGNTVSIGNPELEPLPAFLTNLVSSSSVPESVLRHRRAYLEREKIDYLEVAPYANQFGGEAAFKAERWKNWQKSMKNLPDIQDLVGVSIGFTHDTNLAVITLVDVDSRRASLWTDILKNGEQVGKIRTITEY